MVDIFAILNLYTAQKSSSIIQTGKQSTVFEDYKKYIKPRL